MIKKLLVLVSLPLLIWSCTNEVEVKDEVKSTAEFSNKVAYEWVDTYLSIESDLNGFRPAATSRALGYISIAAYETALPGMPRFKSTAELIGVTGLPSLDPSKKINYELAVNAAYREMLLDLMINMTPTQQSTITNQFESFKKNFSLNVEPDIIRDSENWGKEVAKAVIAYAKSDVEGYTQVQTPQPTNYTPPTGIGLWKPTPPAFGMPLYPYWGKVRTFIAKDQDLNVLPPPPYSEDPSSTWHKDYQEVHDVVAKRNYKDVWMAEFWSDDIVGVTFSPPARLYAIGNQLITLEKLNLENTLHFYVKLGIGLNDASVACWAGKYKYNTERPVDYIRRVIDPAFSPILGRAVGTEGMSPDFPGHPSGHSTFAGVGGSIMADFFGERYTFTDNCHRDRTDFFGTPRTFLTFREMAEENAYSRIPLGVHPRFDCTEGIRLGYQVGASINKLSFRR